MRALVLEHGLNRGALAAVRSLGRAGWDVGVGVSSRAGLASLSRHTRRTHPIPAPGEGLPDFIGGLRGAVAESGYEVVFAVDDEQVLALSAHRDEIPAEVPYAEHAVVERALDRLEQVRLAKRHGLAAPDTREATPQNLAQLGDHVVAVKAQHPRLIGTGHERHRVETRVGPANEAVAWAAEIRAAGGTPIVQERVQGHLLSFTALVDRDGEVIAEEQQVAERIWPAEAGVSVRATTVTVDRALGDAIAGVLGEIGWFGLAQLQFLVPADGRPRLIDLNPRFYGSLALAVAAGADFPALWGALATGRAITTPTIARPGVRYHWLGGDLRRAVRERRDGGLREAAAALLWTRGAVPGVWSAADPAPAVRLVGRTLAGRLRA